VADLSSKNYSIPLGINWHEGMLLSQHHFQETDKISFLILANQLRLVSWYHYGIRHLRIDNIALQNGVFKIDRLEAVFPDGLIIHYLADEMDKIKSVEINIADKFADGQKECTVFLAIAEYVADSSPLLGNTPRFHSIEGGHVSDDNIENNEVKIPRLLPNFFLHIGNTPPDRCTGFPISKVGMADGVFTIKNWTPSCFFIEKHYPLWGRCSKLAVSIREKATFLSEKLQNELVSGVSTDTRRILEQLLQIMPAFEALIYSDHIRPYELYQSLAGILGSVSVFQPLEIAPIMVPYNHDNIDGCIYPIIRLIEHYLTVVESGYATVPFDKKEKFYSHYVSKSDEFRDKKIYIGIRWGAKSIHSNIENWINEVIIVSDFALDSVRSKRVKGAARRFATERMKSNILPGFGVILLEVDLDHNFIKQEQYLHIFNPGDTSETRPVEILIYIPRKKKNDGT
jgi:type VI secretion system protein ImpJ